jgi:hypothetical protein
MSHVLGTCQSMRAHALPARRDSDYCQDSLFASKLPVLDSSNVFFDGTLMGKVIGNLKGLIFSQFADGCTLHRTPRQAVR